MKDKISLNMENKQESALGRACDHIQHIALAAVTACFILAASVGYKKIIIHAEATSMQHGFCLV